MLLQRQTRGAPGHARAPRPTARKAPPAARRADGMPMLLQRQTRGVAFGNACGDDGGNDYDYGLVCVVDDSVATSTTTAPPDAASSIASPPRDLEPPPRNQCAAATTMAPAEAASVSVNDGPRPACASVNHEAPVDDDDGDWLCELLARDDRRPLPPSPPGGCAPGSGAPGPGGCAPGSAPRPEQPMAAVPLTRNTLGNSALVAVPQAAPRRGRSRSRDRAEYYDAPASLVELDELWELRQHQAVKRRSTKLLFSRCPGAHLTQKLDSLMAGNPTRCCYVGATVDPLRRFLGGRSRGGWMDGHAKVWQWMYVVYVGNGDDARATETMLIQHAMQSLGQRCANKVADSRGVSPHEPAFVYICTDRKSHPPPRADPGCRAPGHAHAAGPAGPPPRPWLPCTR